jgi:hypothetical protein
MPPIFHRRQLQLWAKSFEDLQSLPMAHFLFEGSTDRCLPENGESSVVLVIVVRLRSTVESSKNLQHPSFTRKEVYAGVLVMTIQRLDASQKCSLYALSRFQRVLMQNNLQRSIFAVDTYHMECYSIYILFSTLHALDH